VLGLKARSVGDYERALAGANQGIEAAREHGFPESVIGFLLVCRAHSFLPAGMVAEATRDLDEARAMINPKQRMIAIFFFDLVSSAARRFEQEGCHEEALELYGRGIRADELSEPFHQGLMRCHHEVGRTPEALAAYRRMRDVLGRARGIQPSPATEELYRKLTGC
jgi:tetratricopeptide (TPR) repeat protein